MLKVGKESLPRHSYWQKLVRSDKGLLYSMRIVLEGERKMKIFSSKEFIEMENPNPGIPYQPES